MRRYHFIDHQSIVHNGLKLNDKIYNAVRICDPEKNGKVHPIKANKNIPDNYTRVLDVTDQINDPKQNVIDQSNGNTGLMMAYAQSFLLEEVGKMYRCELVLRGIPEIEPADVLPITRSPRPAQLQKPHACARARSGRLFGSGSCWTGSRHEGRSYFALLYPRGSGVAFPRKQS